MILAAGVLIGMWMVGMGRKEGAPAPPEPLEETGPQAVRAAKRAEALIRIHVQSLVKGSDVFHFGAVEIDPKHLSLWITTPKDKQRDAFRADAALDAKLRQILNACDYPAEAIADMTFTFESKETVDRDYSGDWWAMVK